MFICFDRIHKRDGQTDRRTDTQHRHRMTAKAALDAGIMWQLNNLNENFRQFKEMQILST